MAEDGIEPVVEFPSSATLAEKIKKGQKFTPEEKEAAKKAYREEMEKPVSLDELEKANDQILRRLMKQVNNVPAKELPKMHDIIKTAIAEKKSRGEKTKDETKEPEPTREEMLTALQGRRVEKAP